jgi:hypothetical protein
MTKVADVQHEIEARFDSLKHGFSDKAGAVKDSAMSGIEFLGAQIKKHPVAAVAIAFGIGYVAMRVMRR